MASEIPLVPNSECIKCVNDKRCSLRCEYKYREAMHLQHMGTVTKCVLTDKCGQGCGMPAAFVVDASFKWSHGGFCGDKHEKLYSSGKWREVKSKYLLKKKETLLLAVAKLDDLLNALNSKHVSAL